MEGHVGVTHYSASRDKGNWKRGEDDKETLNKATKEFCFHKLGEKATELEEDFRYLLLLLATDSHTKMSRSFAVQLEVIKLSDEKGATITAFWKQRRSVE